MINILKFYLGLFLLAGSLISWITVQVPFIGPMMAQMELISWLASSAWFLMPLGAFLVWVNFADQMSLIKLGVAAIAAMAILGTFLPGVHL